MASPLTAQIGDKEEKDDTAATTIDDMVTSIFVDDLQRAIGVIGCSPQAMEDAGVCSTMDYAQEFVTEGHCFHSQQTPKAGGDLLESERSKVELLYDGDYSTVVSTATSHSIVTNDDTYQSFEEISAEQGHPRRGGFLQKLFKTEK